MEVRVAGPADAAQIAEVHVRSSQAAYAALPASVLAVTFETRHSQWVQVLADPRSRVWVATTADQVVGFCYLYGPDMQASAPGEAEIRSLYLDPEFWGRGLGRRLVNAAEGRAAELGFQAVALSVYAANDRARAVYQTLGFRAAPEIQIHERSGLPLMRYRKLLGPGV